MTRTRPTLTSSGIDARTYHASCFERDLADVVAKDGAPYTRLSVASFCPDFPEVPIYADPGCAFRALHDSCWFLCALFAAQLADQATHCVTGAVGRDRAGTHGALVLVGLLGSYWHVMDPAFLLLALALYDPPVPIETLREGIRALVSKEFEALRSHPSSSQIVHAARASLAYLPESLRAFVPDGDAYTWQPDRALADVLRTVSLEALARTAV
jgi:hypothetical protein